MSVPCANDHRAWARYGSPTAKKKGAPAHSSRPGSSPAGKRAGGDQAVQLGVGEPESPVLAEQVTDRIPRRMLDRSMHGQTGLVEADLDQRQFERRPAIDVLVQRRRPNPEFIGQSSHRQPLGADSLEQYPCCVNDLAGPRGAFPGRRSRSGD